MQLTVNGESRRFDAGEMTVAELLDRLDVAQRRGVAVAVGYDVVPRSQWDDWTLSDGQAVEIIRATQGG